MAVTVAMAVLTIVSVVAAGSFAIAIDGLELATRNLLYLLLSRRINWPLYQLVSKGVDRGSLEGKFRPGFCFFVDFKDLELSEWVRLGEDEVPDDPNVLRTQYSVKILV